LGFASYDLKLADPEFFRVAIALVLRQGQVSFEPLKRIVCLADVAELVLKRAQQVANVSPLVYRLTLVAVYKILGLDAKALGNLGNS